MNTIIRRYKIDLVNTNLVGTAVSASLLPQLQDMT